MFTLVPTIRDRLASALGAGWSVGDGTLAHDRRQLPRAMVRMDAFAVTASSGAGVTLSPRYIVQLAASTDATTYEQIDAAVDVVIARLHHWAPSASKGWRLQLRDSRELQALEQGLFGFELLFATTTTRNGCKD